MLITPQLTPLPQIAPRRALVRVDVPHRLRRFFFLGRMRAKRDAWRGASVQLVDDLLFYGVIGVILAVARLCAVLQAGYYLAHPLEIFAVWQGGMSFHGASSRAAAAWLVGRKGERGFSHL